MRWLLRSTTIDSHDRGVFGRRGFTILELAVSSTLFLTAFGILLILFHQSHRATNKAIESTDVSSLLLLLFEKVRGELKGVRVLGTTVDGKLEYWKVRSVDGVPQLTPLGRPEYLPGLPASPESAFLFSENGLVVAEFQDIRRNLARLGSEGQLLMLWQPAVQTLTLNGEVAQGSQRAHFSFRLPVRNNE